MVWFADGAGWPDPTPLQQLWRCLTAAVGCRLCQGVWLMLPHVVWEGGGCDRQQHARCVGAVGVHTRHRALLQTCPGRCLTLCCAVLWFVGLQAKVETVVRISASGKRSDEHSSDSSSSSDTTSNATSTAAAAAAGTPASSKNANTTSSGGSSAAGGSSGGSSHGDKEAPSAERGVDRIIDSQDNEFVLSAPPKDQVATLTLDPLLIQDLTFLFASAAVSGDEAGGMSARSMQHTPVQQLRVAAVAPTASLLHCLSGLQTALACAVGARGQGQGAHTHTTTCVC